WEDHFSSTDPWEDSPCEDGCPITDWIYWMMPDRPNGYDLFEQAALGFGGPGALYDPTSDGDNMPSPDPYHGGNCPTDGVYVNYCYRNDQLTGAYPGGAPGSAFVYPIGRMVFADLAGDGTTPPTGTVVRLLTTKAPVVANEPGVGGLPETYALSAVYPNPFRARATVTYALPAHGRVRVAVYDVLGREVAVLAEGMQQAGH